MPLLSCERITSSLVAGRWDRCCYATGILPFYALQQQHGTFNFFKACVRLSRLQLCGAGSMSFSAHLLQARTMSHREGKWWAEGSSTSLPAHAAFPSCVKFCGHGSSTGVNTSQATPVWSLTPSCGQRAAGKGICPEEACLWVHMFYLLCCSNPVDEPVFIMTSYHHTKSYLSNDLESSSFNLCQMLSYCFITICKATFRCENFSFKIKFLAHKPKTQKTG